MSEQFSVGESIRKARAEGYADGVKSGMRAGRLLEREQIAREVNKRDKAVSRGRKAGWKEERKRILSEIRLMRERGYENKKPV